MVDLMDKLTGRGIEHGWEMVAHREDPIERITLWRQTLFHSMPSMNLEEN
jgi:hypothetical protein